MTPTSSLPPTNNSAPKRPSFKSSWNKLRFFRNLSGPSATVGKSTAAPRGLQKPKATADLTLHQVLIEPMVLSKDVHKLSLVDELEGADELITSAHKDPVYGYTNPDHDLASELQVVRGEMLAGFNKRTTKVETGHWKKWKAFCRHRGLRVWRDDHAANDGRDREGYQREVDILASFLLHLLRTMKSSKKRPRALPNSAANVIRGLRRIHKKRSPPINMVPMSAVTPVLKSMTSKYMRKYGYRTLLPRRREPWRNKHLKKMFAMRGNTRLTLGGIRVSHTVFWKSFFALEETLAQCGMRSSEALVQKVADWHPSDHLSRASLLWVFHDKPSQPVTSPTARQLKNLTEQDYAVIVPPPSKTDAFGVIWGDKPIYLPVRFDASFCAALRLQELELALPLEGEDRAQAPLFCDEDKLPITYSTAYAILNDQKKLVLTDEFDSSLFSFHSFRVYLATSLAAAGASDAQIQAMCRWQTVESLRIYKRFQPAQCCDLLDRAQQVVIQSYTAANLPTISSYQIAAGIHAWRQRD